MGKNFVPDIYQIAEKRVQSKEPLQIYANPLYHLMYLPSLLKPLEWFGKTKNFEYSNLFLIGFRCDTDTEQIYDVFTKEFGNQVDKIIRISYYLYEIQLNDKLIWEEIFNRVNHALDGVVVDVTG